MLEITKKAEGACVQVILNGRLDTVTSPELEKAVQAVFEENAKEIVFDFSTLAYISSAGLRVILSTQKKLNASGGSLIIRHPNEMVMEVFDATGFCDILTIEQ